MTGIILTILGIVVIIPLLVISVFGSAVFMAREWNIFITKEIQQ